MRKPRPRLPTEGGFVAWQGEGWPSQFTATARREQAAASAAGAAAGHPGLDGVCGHLIDMLGDTEAAAAHFWPGAARTTSAPEQYHLIIRAAGLNQPSREGPRARR